MAKETVSKLLSDFFSDEEILQLLIMVEESKPMTAAQIIQRKTGLNYIHAVQTLKQLAKEFKL